MKVSAALIFFLGFFAIKLSAETQLVETEATIQSGTAAVSNIVEEAAGYIHIKYHAPLTVSRKAYFQFNLTNSSADLESSAQFQIFFNNSYQQRIQLWGLNQSYSNFNADITWNNAQANDTNSNSLLTNGAFTATAIGTNALVPSSGTTPFTFTIPRLSDFIFGNKITLALSGVDDPANNAAGLRLLQNSASLTFSTTNPPVTDTNQLDVYLVGGQSNMDGRGYRSDLVGAKSFWNQPQTNVQIYYANPVNNDPINPTYNTGWQTFGLGFSVPPGFSGALPSTRFGPELSFAKAISDATPNRRIALIKITQGGTSLSSDWKPTSGYMYKTFTNIVRVALSELETQGRTYTVRGMIWHQGESDSSGSALTNYETNMTQLIAAVRRDVGITNLPFVVGEVATNKIEELRAAQFRLSENIPFVGFASADELETEEGTHFISDSVLILGQRFANGIETPTLRFSSATVQGNNITLNTSCLGKSRFHLLSSTNLTQWTTLSTNQLNDAGELQLIRSIDPTGSATFFSLRAE